MTQVLFATAFLLGAFVVAWIGFDFVGSDTLALTVTLVIAVVYVIGGLEQFQFRRKTASLAAALNKAKGNIDNLDEWLTALDPSLQNPVRLRIEGERIPLPMPVLTPYLVGLLVMLGLLGTFVGMVVTLKGAVVALEGTTELQAVRAGLAAPIHGLGLAFGTSVAGVAASAMLGLISTLSRRERMLETNRLDTLIGSVFKKFSLVHNRQETFKALQYQAQALPQVADTLQQMAIKLEQMGDTMAEKLEANQNDFHQSVSGVYQNLAASVESSLKNSISNNSALVGEAIKPILKETMEQIAASSSQAVADSSELLKNQLASLTTSVTRSTADLNADFQSALQQQHESSNQLMKDLKGEVAAYAKEFVSNADQLVNTFNAASDQWMQTQIDTDQARLSRWDETLQEAQSQAASKVNEATAAFINSFATVSGELKGVSQDLTQQWQQTSDQAVKQHQAVSQSFTDSLEQIQQHRQTENAKLLDNLFNTLQQSEKLVATRLASEQHWLEQQSQRSTALADTLKQQLQELGQAEQQRSNAAMDRFEQLEKMVAEHLSQLGQSLEAPMTRLIGIASETPKAAAQVIEKLKAEISNTMERDNKLLAERQSIMEDLTRLLGTIKDSASGQQASIETLVESSASMMKGISEHFATNINSEVSRMNGMSDQLETATADMSALAESFSTGVQLFSESNQNMLDNLVRVEASLEASSARNDEQLAYYVSQAREIIDHSMMSQKGILEELKQLSRQPDLFTEKGEH